MEVNSAVLKIIVKECCRPLSYNDDERLFSFPLRNSLYDFWKNKRDLIRRNITDFTLDDFNAVLSKLEQPTDAESKSSHISIKDNELLNGELLSLGVSETPGPIKLIKMKRGQYLDVSTGRGLSLGDKFEFYVGGMLLTSEGEEYGVCKNISLLEPSIYNIVLSRVFLGKYYSHNVGATLWPIFDEAMNYLNSRDSNLLANIMKLSAKSGVGTFALLNILTGVCALRK